MRVEHLRVWIEATNREETPDSTNCLKVVDLTQTVF